MEPREITERIGDATGIILNWDLPNEVMRAVKNLKIVSFVVLTPHTAYITPEAVATMLDIAIGNLEAFFAGSPTNVATNVATNAPK